MKLVFVSGPYRAETVEQRQSNIMKARAKSIELWKQGYAVICPHMNTAHFDGMCPDEVWLEGDIEILRRCDVIAMVDGWESSVGAKAELEIAEQLGMEILKNEM